MLTFLLIALQVPSHENMKKNAFTVDVLLDKITLSLVTLESKAKINYHR